MGWGSKRVGSERKTGIPWDGASENRRKSKGLQEEKITRLVEG